MTPPVTAHLTSKIGPIYESGVNSYIEETIDSTNALYVAVHLDDLHVGAHGKDQPPHTCFSLHLALLDLDDHRSRTPKIRGLSTQLSDRNPKKHSPINSA